MFEENERAFVKRNRLAAKKPTIAAQEKPFDDERRSSFAERNWSEDDQKRHDAKGKQPSSKDEPTAVQRQGCAFESKRSVESGPKVVTQEKGPSAIQRMPDGRKRPPEDSGRRPDARPKRAFA
jgi:hypothetical protein